MVKGIYHSHSDFSYDGVKSLSDISEWCKERDLDFIILTEHNDDFSLEKFREFHSQCQHHSSEVLLVPGIEYEFIVNGKVVHVGAVGLQKYFDINKNPILIETFLDAVREEGGGSILHHPHRIMAELSDKVICKFDFIEAWNVVHDISYAPNKKVIKKAERTGFSGRYLASRDIHYFRDKDNIPYIVLDQNVAIKSSREIIDSLLGGQYYMNSNVCNIRPDGTFVPTRSSYKYLPLVSLVHQNAYERLREFYKKTIKVAPPKWLVKAIK